MNMRAHGFTLSELLVGIVIGAIVILTVGVVGEISTAAYSRLRSRSGVYNDAQFALDLITGTVHAYSSQLLPPPGNCLQVGSDNFYIDSSGQNFVYGSSCGSGANTAIIKSVTGLTFTPTVTGQLVHVDLSGTKNGAAFSVSGDVMKRLP